MKKNRNNDKDIYKTKDLIKGISIFILLIIIAILLFRGY